jgi:hypothetical protein
MSRVTRKLRGIALGIDAPDERFTQASVASSQTIISYDIALIRVSGLLRLFRQGEPAFTERPTVAGYQKPGREALQALEACLARRHTEFAEFLNRGKTLVVILGPPEEYTAFTRVEEQTDEHTGKPVSVSLHERRTTLTQMMPAGIDVEPFSGDSLRLATGGAFAEFWARWGDIFHHEAVLTNHPGVTVVRVEGTTKAAAVILKQGEGTLLLLPDFSPFSYEPGENVEGDNRAFVDLIDAIVHLVDRLSGVVELPDWADTLQLPGESAARRRLSTAEAKVEHWRAEMESRAEHLRTVERRKGLVTATGDALEQLVEEALQALGFQVEVGDNGRVDRVLRLGKRVAVVEVKGQKGSAKESDAAQLNKWVAAHHADHGQLPKGILVVNAFNQTPLEERTGAPFPAQMLPFAVSQQQFCLITGNQLLAAWLVADATPDKRAELAASILDCVGIYPGPVFT